MSALKRFVLWDYARASWQYDVIVALILAFIFLTPHEIFRDQPKAASVAMVRGGYWIEAQQLYGTPETAMPARATALVNAHFKTHTEIVSVEPIYDDAENELKGYLAFPRQ
ncbi:MAG TPA: hypothetical protein VGR73_12205 [Bryobacteraceae bacterium]|nr:hypothetical protein [Bryobacteraceae bacterium]